MINRLVKYLPVLLFVAGILLGLESCNPVFKTVKRQDPAKRKTNPNNPVSVMITEDIAYGDKWLHQKGIDTLTLKTTDNILLKGYYLAASTSSKKLAVLIHGHGADARMMTKYGAMYHNWGYNVFMADARGHGNSGGNYIGSGWLDRIDYLQWLQLLFEKYGSNQQVILHGISMGAATTMMMSGEKTLPIQVKAIIEDAGYTTIWDVYKHQMKHSYHIPAFPLLNLASGKTKRKAGYSFHDADALKQVKKSQTPILFIHSEADKQNPVTSVHKLYEAATCPKELLIVPNSLHAMAYHDALELYSNTVKSFIEKYIIN